MEGVKRLENLKASKSSDFDLQDWKEKCYKAMGDDFNTPILIAHLFDGIKFVNQVLDKKKSISATDLGGV